MNPLLRSVLLAAIVCVLSEAKPGIGLVRYCTTNDDCDLGFYCFASFDPAICSPCIDCSRARKKNPADGCAQHTDECGPCFDGYTAQGIRCLEDEVPGLIQTLDSAVTEGGSDSLIITIISLSIGLIIVLFLCLFYYNRWKRLERVRRQCPKSFGGEIPQTSASEECIGLASAPPATELEYDRPDPYNRNFILNPLPPQRFMTDTVRLINDQRQQADPFSAGNSYGQNTIDYLNHHQQPNSGDEDDLDGDAEDVIAALLDIEMDEPGVQHVNPELPLAEVSINLENMHHDDEEPMDFEPMDFDEDGMVPRAGDELEDGNANDSGFSNSTSTSGLDQIVPISTAPPKVNHIQILAEFFANLSSTIPSQQPAQGDGLLPNVLPNVEEFQGGILQNVDVNNAELVVVFSEENFGEIVNDSGLSLNEDSYAHETSLSFENIGDD